MQTDRTTPRRAAGAAAGSLGVAAALGLSEFLGGVLAGASSLVAAVGQTIIDLQPPGAKDLVVALFGTNDKLAFELFIVGVALAIGAALGVVGRGRPTLARMGFIAFGAIGWFATFADPLVEPLRMALVATVSVILAIAVMTWFAGRAGESRAGDARPDPGRRRLLVSAGGLVAASIVGGVGGRVLLARAGSAPPGVEAAIPPPSDTVQPFAAAADLAPTVDGLSPIVVPNDRFYRIDTALITPSVDHATWSLRIHGLVDRETRLTYAELVGLPLFEQYVTIACVSNEVGGNLVGNAKWTGVRLREVLDLAGVHASASQLVGRSVDGWTAGMPTAWILDADREPMIAVAMNDEPLPRAHGFPARLIVPGLYGYVSATKWLSELELTTMEAFDAYWVPLGWAKEAPILTQSRIDTPRPGGGGVTAGRVPIAGVAWAPDRGISAVEVAIDGEWRPARLSAPISDATWVQWVYDWDATPGRHRITVRATDGGGVVQEERRSPPAPDGARGWHTVDVTVS
jgi:DMSO/TMAO reductase YedYZ molybdopterin-dependent catalytic subunit